MSQTIIPRALPMTSVSRFGRLDRLARDVLSRRLDSIGRGRVTLEDPETRRAFGRLGDLGATIRIEDPRAYRRMVLGGGLGAADAWIRGWWSADDLTRLLRIFVRNIAATDEIESGLSRLAGVAERMTHVLRRNTRAGSRRNIHAHYDLGNDLFELFLDPTMTYSCGIFESPSDTMEQASVRKLDRVCRKLGLAPGQRVLEIGTGWGSLAMHAAKHYGCHVTTTTVSREQHDLARDRIDAAGLSDLIDLRLVDYRDLDGRYDRVMSIEMIEAVGHDFLGTYFERCGQLLEPDGLMLLQAITMPDHRYERYRRTVDFIQRYVFPGSCVPSLQAMTTAMAGSGDLRVVHLEDLTPHYATTLARWRDAFNANLAAVGDLGYPEEFIRLWNYYLCYCEAGFAERYTGVVQLLLSRPDARPAPIRPAYAEAVT